ncbi:arginyl-tRNA synthetase [Caldanaerobius fijiensis DSM 17918]|uniref:Arginine--tRNA ligase n=1 Tax=Caldanaerobius fijiensis DSM 17918 TaxID=1121256 RepID=A0A1M5AG35_9THEO|nr:arginine--tRNA ligase [Caldanaerobius fijiensis]SHF29199.1 arginyl-tRNA synthetase [Caldanaerobius fijiensis DSM 17918]
MINIVMDIKNNLINSIKRAINKAAFDGVISFDEVPEIEIEVPKEKNFGDFSTNVAMRMASILKKNPRQIAQAIAKYIDDERTEKVDVAGPGFINFYLKKDWVYDVIPAILREGEDYGRSNIGKGEKVQVEYVSANPTGPMHMGNARGGAIGDSIASILEASGYNVTREFYINDAGNQIEKFALSLEARYLQLFGQPAEIPENGYHGEDIVERAKEFKDIYGDRYLNTSPEERRKALCDYALKKNVEKLKADLEAYGIKYDVWFSEQSLYDSGKVDDVIKTLKANGSTYEKDGAIWFKASDYGAPKDEVLVRSNGIPTYLASDIAYHRDKFIDRGFERVITVLGADHHGHMARMHAAMKALGIDPERLQFIILQLVRLVRGKEVVRMSKRTGKAISLIDLIEEVGKDAARFFFTMRSADSQMDFDLDLAVQKSNENPVYYVQYAHARICSMESILKQEGIALRDPDKIDYSALKQEVEWELMRKLADYPEEVALAAQNLEPHRITRYLLDLAGLFHNFYNTCRVKGEEEELLQARFALALAVKVVIKNGLDLLKITAPERM